ncbi:hypothetical protein E3N88_17462 [Mikania micrantha]|uniref:Integrase catalytic domain-containing protein n=1 Tax=Mikania micrantha TaxID=192012 RepID=A0A5N6NRZ2_9ASTR|nr:hypothetical protein E3N88_17462 [Mikania micrantha]
MSYSQKCDACQRHSNILHQPAEPLHPIVSSWPFMKWGMDVVGKLPKAPGGKVFMLAMTDYFSKWIEEEAFVQVREKEVVSFIKRNILTRFGIPAEITCDNGSQFIGKRTINFCESWGIKMITSTPVHPQANKGKWAEELPFVLWADRTTTKNATGQTPFSLVYGSEAVLPTEMVIPTARSSLQNLESNKETLSEDLDTIDELRDIARIRMATYQQKIAKSYNKNIRIRRFQIGDLVLRKAFQNTTNPTDGKLAPKWEGPYKIDSEAGKGAYKLTNMEGEPLPRSWNAIHLKYSRRRDETLCLNPRSDLKSELDEDPALTLCPAAKDPPNSGLVASIPALVASIPALVASGLVASISALVASGLSRQYLGLVASIPALSPVFRP